MIQAHQFLGLILLSGHAGGTSAAFLTASVHEVRSSVGPRNASSPSHLPPTQVTKTLGLLSFDLDDTLFPIRPVVKDANEAQMEFINETAEAKFTVADFVAATKRIRTELSQPITYTALRKRAIRELIGVNHSVDEAFDVWLKERQASANRNLYADAIETLDTLRSSYPNVPFVAITNGRGDPREIPKLRPYFDDCISGEDTNIRKPDPRIFDRALRNIDMHTSHWIHVGDCLANDVGASASCGALAVWLDRAADADGLAEWSTATARDRMERQKLQQDAKEKIAVRIDELSKLPAAIQDLLHCQWM